MLVDTGVDYTLLPKSYAGPLGVDLRRDCAVFRTLGVGGTRQVHLRTRHRVRLGPWEARIPIGFLEEDEVPPLLGRQGFLERLRVVFDRRTTTISLTR